MREYRSKLRLSRLVPLVAVAILGSSLVSACGGTKNSKVELSISPAGLSEVENAAPSKDYALYVAAGSVPRSAADLANYAVVLCTGETAVNRAMAVQMGILDGIGGSHNINTWPAGDSTADGIKKALAGELTGGQKSLVIVKRGSEVPSDAVEVVLK